MKLGRLLPTQKDIHVEGLEWTPQRVEITVRSTATTAPCPSCGGLSRRLHSRYQRTLMDLPWADFAVKITLGVGRFFCDDAACERRIFTERVPAIADVFARRTRRLEVCLRVIGMALGGEAGSRLTRHLNIPTSPDTIIRTILNTTKFEPPAPRVVGVDDWAWCKGRSYGTIFVDLERRRVLDILPDHTAESLAKWLQSRASIQIVARDRGNVCLDGTRRGAPNAVQVADRWHVITNITDCMRRLVSRRWSALKPHLHSPEVNGDPGGEKATEEQLTNAARISLERRSRRLSRYQDVLRLHGEGYGIREIARKQGMSRRTVRMFLRTESFPERAQSVRPPGLLAPFVEYLRSRWNAGCNNGLQLWRELREMGYKGSRGLVSIWVARKRKKALKEAKLGSGGRPPTLRQVVWRLILPVADLTVNEATSVTGYREACAEIAIAHDLTQLLNRILRRRDNTTLSDWLKAALACGVMELVALARGIKRDEAAIAASLRLEWSTGQVEGQNHRIKLLKRQMYGRAGFELLRQRILHAH